MDITLETFFIALFLTLLAGLSTGIGAAIAFFSKFNNDKVFSIGLGFSAGVMIYVSFIEIFPKARESFSLLYNDQTGHFLVVVFFFLGIALTAFIDRLIPTDINPHELKSDIQDKISESKHKHLKRAGIFTAIAIAIHNFPEGFATFVASTENLTLGISIAIAVAIHNIPEGMAISLPIYKATQNKKQAFYYALASGLAEPLGAILGFLILLPILGEMALGVTFAVVAGIMVYISLDELLPSSRVYGDSHTAILGVSLGMLVMAISLLIL
ncbi:zinc transporter ZupT [Arcobacter sp. FWKO B]|uniref:zinc transporter ZupT n=1 Tax=Arcobacter sp. FWKO B TaxID=2593672 RepID=UPI003A4C57F0